MGKVYTHQDLTSLISISGVFHIQPSVTMVWKDVATITIQKGDYYCGDAWLNLAQDTDWSWVLDTGVETISTWYYLYAYNDSGRVGIIVSATAPTSRLNTVLSGTTYNYNVYLGAFYNNNVGDIFAFNHCGDKFLFTVARNTQTTNNAAYQAKPILVPATTNLAIVKLRHITAAGYSVLSADGIFEYGVVYEATAGDSTSVQYIVPIVTTATMYIKIITGGVAQLETFGWIDKFL
jgi:hypothetical protein